MSHRHGLRCSEFRNYIQHFKWHTTQYLKKCISVYQVETLGDAVYMVAGGVPDRRPNHAGRVAGLALELITKAQLLKDPVSQKHLQLRIGIKNHKILIKKMTQIHHTIRPRVKIRNQNSKAMYRKQDDQKNIYKYK